MFTKKFVTLIIFIIFTTLLLLAGCSQLQQGLVPAVENNPASGALSFSLQSPASEGITRVSLKASSVENFKGYSVILSYDPSLEIAEVIEGDFLASKGTTFFYPNINKEEGTLQIDCALLGKDLAVSGTGTLADIRFVSGKSGSAALTFSQTKVRDVSNQEIDLSKENFRF